MLITKLKSKIHNATVNSVELKYEGSCAICSELLRIAEISEGEQIHVFNQQNGERFITYAMSSDVPGTISIRGPGARKVMEGDTIIICTYCQVNHGEKVNQKIVFVDENNEPTNIEI